MQGVTWIQYRAAVAEVKIGKRLPGALYLHHSAIAALSRFLREQIERAATAAQPDGEWNILKLHIDKFVISFLSYPDFTSDPYPALAEATKI
jgi:hypothetical protein